MSSRRPIQQSHERFFVQEFLNWFNGAYRSNFKVLCEPNPPDAVIGSMRTTRWIEISTAFWNSAYAKDLYSFATPDEAHKPMASGPYSSMDQEFAENFVQVVKNKLEKTSYIYWRDKYGPGYLIIPIKHPWLDDTTIQLMKQEWTKASINDIGCFRSVRIAFSSINRIQFMRWP